MKYTISIAAMIALLAAPATSYAQQSEETETAAEAMVESAEIETDTPADAAEDENAEELNPDESADMLNSRQQLQQTFTLKRSINGEVVETTKKTVTLTPGVPYRPTEAGETTMQQVRAAFDSEVLTRVEAFEEAKLDFTIADSDRDGRMTASEFAILVDSWRETNARMAEAPNEEVARQRQYEALLATIDPDAAEQQNKAYAKAKFAFISGASEDISREDYIREYLLDFDTMDSDNNALLKGGELMRFRAANRGETVDM